MSNDCLSLGIQFDEDCFDCDCFDCAIEIVADDIWLKVRVPFRFAYEARIVKAIKFHQEIETRIVKVFDKSFKYVLRLVRVEAIKQAIEVRALKILKSQFKYVARITIKIKQRHKIIARVTKVIVHTFKIEARVDSYRRKILDLLDTLDDIDN